MTNRKFPTGLRRISLRGCKRTEVLQGVDCEVDTFGVEAVIDTALIDPAIDDVGAFESGEMGRNGRIWRLDGLGELGNVHLAALYRSCQPSVTTQPVTSAASACWDVPTVTS